MLIASWPLIAVHPPSAHTTTVVTTLHEMWVRGTWHMSNNVLTFLWRNPVNPEPEILSVPWKAVVSIAWLAPNSVLLILSIEYWAHPGATVMYTSAHWRPAAKALSFVVDFTVGWAQPQSTLTSQVAVKFIRFGRHKEYYDVSVFQFLGIDTYF